MKQNAYDTLATCVNTLIDAGFAVKRISEPAPALELLAEHPDWRDETRRPMFLVLSATKAAITALV